MLKLIDPERPYYIYSNITIDAAVQQTPNYKFTLQTSPDFQSNLLKFFTGVSSMIKSARKEMREKHPSLLS